MIEIASSFRASTPETRRYRCAAVSACGSHVSETHRGHLVLDRYAPVFVFAIVSCAGRTSTSLARPHVDTLPGGVLEVENAGPSAWTDTNGWKLVEVLRLGGAAGTGSGELIRPQDVTMDAAGRVYVAEADPPVIKQYDSTGKFIRIIGRSGEGPGEYGTAYLASRGDHLFVHDPRLSRTSLFDTAGRYLKSWKSACCYWMAIGSGLNGTVAVPTFAAPPPGTTGRNPYGRKYLRYDSTGTLRDSVLIPSGPDGKFWFIGSDVQHARVITSVPFVPEDVMGIAPDGSLLRGWSGAYRIVVSRTGVDTAAVFGRAWTPALIPDAVRSAEVESRVRNFKEYDQSLVRAAFHLADVPTTAPAFDWIGQDDSGYRWVRLPRPGDSTRTLFDVFDHAGAWLGQVAGPRYLRGWSLHLAGDHLITISEDADGLPIVVVYRIDRRIH